jgi:hypothetical protein
MSKLIYRKVTASLYRKKPIKPSIFQQFDPVCGEHKKGVGFSVRLWLYRPSGAP